MTIARFLPLGLVLAGCSMMASAAEDGASAFPLAATLQKQLPRKLQEHSTTTLGVAIIQNDQVIWSGVYIPQTHAGAVVFVNGAKGQPLILDTLDLIGHQPSISGFMRALQQD